MNPIERGSQRLAQMKEKLSRGVPAKGLLTQFSGDVLYDLADPLVPSNAVIADCMESMYDMLYDRIMRDVDAGHRHSWEPIASEIKLFFEVGFRCRGKFPAGPAQNKIFVNYVEMLNLFLTAPEELPASETPEGLWLRPTVAAAAGSQGEASLRLQNSLIPDMPARNDVLLDLYWDLELDIWRRPAGHRPHRGEVMDRKKKSTLRMAATIIQNCDYASHMFDESKPKSPPVVVLCHSKGMVLKLADLLNYMGRYEYGMGYRGAEAAYRDTEAISDVPVTILVCTPGRLLHDVKEGAISLHALDMLVMSCQMMPVPKEYMALRSMCPETVRTLMFSSIRHTPKNILQTAEEMLTHEPQIASWDYEEQQPTVVVAPFVPGVTTLPSKNLPPAPFSTTGKGKGKGKGESLLPDNFAPTGKGAGKGSMAGFKSDFNGMGLHGEIMPIMKKHKLTIATPLQKTAIPSMMTGRSCLFISPPQMGTALAFVLPTVHLMMNYPPGGMSPRVLVMAERREDVDCIVAEYLRFTQALPRYNMAPEGLHSTRLTDYDTPVNTSASVIVGTPHKLANSILKPDSTTPIDVSLVDVLILQGLGTVCKNLVRPECKDENFISHVYHAIVNAKKQAPQVVAFSKDFSADAVQSIVVGVVPDIEVLNIEG
jgi:superfamily II DNA/RNA helicase|uniref:RNA helicase n=1 Tax=Eutreptiella gymnastica TaxID=73025 RepID=A0A7S4LDS9_9EUGL